MLTWVDNFLIYYNKLLNIKLNIFTGNIVTKYVYFLLFYSCYDLEKGENIAQFCTAKTFVNFHSFVRQISFDRFII